MTDDPDALLAAKLKTWIRDRMTGGCRMLSEGEACQCPLCNVDALLAALTALRGRQQEVEKELIDTRRARIGDAETIGRWQREAVALRGRLAQIREWAKGDVVPPTIATDDEFRDVYTQAYQHARKDVARLAGEDAPKA